MSARGRKGVRKREDNLKRQARQKPNPSSYLVMSAQVTDSGGMGEIHLCRSACRRIHSQAMRLADTSIIVLGSGLHSVEAARLPCRAPRTT
nr:hypothetical protein CFP56_38976 [Quercus suber]